MYLCILYLLLTLQKMLMAKTLNSACIIHLHLSQERRKTCCLNDFENMLCIFIKRVLTGYLNKVGVLLKPHLYYLQRFRCIYHATEIFKRINL